MSNSFEVSSSAGFVLAWQGDLFEGTVQATSLFLDAALDMSKLQTSHPGSISHSTWFLVAEDVQVLLNLYCREPCRWNDGAVRWRNISVARVVACSFHFMCVCVRWMRDDARVVGFWRWFVQHVFICFTEFKHNQFMAYGASSIHTLDKAVLCWRLQEIRFTYDVFLAVRPSSFQHTAVRLYSVCSQQAGWYFVGL